jgi:hypothetical protein
LLRHEHAAAAAEDPEHSTMNDQDEESRTNVVKYMRIHGDLHKCFVSEGNWTQLKYELVEAWRT